MAGAQAGGGINNPSDFLKSKRVWQQAPWRQADCTRARAAATPLIPPLCTHTNTHIHNTSHVQIMFVSTPSRTVLLPHPGTPPLGSAPISVLLEAKGFWRREWHPTPVFLPGKSHGQRSLLGYSPWDCKESDTTERLHFQRLLRRSEISNTIAPTVPHPLLDTGPDVDQILANHSL